MHDFFVAAEGEKKCVLSLSNFCPFLFFAFACCASLKNGIFINGVQIRGQISN